MTRVPAAPAASPVAATGDPDLHGRTVWALDTLSRVYQLFHALPEMSAPDGTPVSAIFGLTRDLLDVTGQKRPDYLFCAMDAPGPTFRHERYPDYKATRAEMPADLVPQIPLVRRLYAVCGIPCLELPGYEADDLLATLAVRTVAAGGDCTIATADKDARQLLGDHVRLMNLRTNAPFGVAELAAEWGIRPDQVVDFLALVGDAVDNVPGVPGIGPKNAAELLAGHDTLEGVLANVDTVPGAKRRENLRLHAATARAGRELIRLATDVPLEIPWEAGRRHLPDPAALAEFLREMGFKSLLARVVKDAPRPAAVPPPAPRRTERGGPRTLFDAIEAAEEAATADPKPLTLAPADEPAIAVVVARLGPGPVTICCGRGPGVTTDPAGSMTPPAGVALTGDAVAAWIDARAVAGSPSLRRLLADGAVPKHGHDLKRQWLAFAALGVEFRGLAFDTLLAAYLLEAGERNLGLSEVAVRYGVAAGVPGEPAVDPTALDDPADAPAAVAACRTAAGLAAILPARLEEEGLARLFHDVEMPLAVVLAGMERRGVRIDKEVLRRLSADYTAKLAALEQEIHALAGHPFLIGSPVQVRTVLFDELGLPVVKRTKTGPSTDAEVLEQLADRHPLPARLLDHRRYAKLKSTYVDALPALVNPATGRIHTSFNQTATATGRLSSSDPNLQNIPVRSEEGQQIRAAFLPGEPGWRFVSADYSQIELRVLAHLSGDGAMRRAFAAGEDIHTSTAAAVFGIDAALVSPAQRRAAKGVNFGILYGQSGFGLAKALGIPQAEAAAFIAAYFRTFAGAAAFMDDALDRCRRDGHVTTLLGRRRAISGVRDRAGRRSSAGGFALTLPERTAINTVVQGSAADLIKLAMLGVSRRLAAEGCRAGLVLQIHDELLLETPPGESGAVRELVVAEMLGAMPLEVPLEVSVHEGATWAECEK